MRKLLLPLLFLLLTNCSNVKLIEAPKEQSLMDDLAISHFGEKYAVKKNKSGSYIIVFKKYKKIEDLFATVKFFIFEVKTQSIIFQDELNAGSVKWYSDSKIIAISRNLQTEGDKNQKSTITYYYDVKKKKKILK